jgi:hypothetical protein
MCLEAYTDPGVPLTLACAAPFGVTLPPTHPAANPNIVNINKLGHSKWGELNASMGRGFEGWRDDRCDAGVGMEC